jgi:hypothetical protein
MIREPGQEYSANWAKEVTRLLASLSQGIVVVTPDGSAKYRIAVDNAGSVTATLVTE